MAYGTGRDIASTATSRAAQGASLGTMIAPGIGTAIGAGIGLVGGGVEGFFANKDDRDRLKELERLEEMGALGLTGAEEREARRTFVDPAAAAARQSQSQMAQFLPMLGNNPGAAIAAQAQLQESQQQAMLAASQEVESVNQAKIGAQKAEMEDARSRMMVQSQLRQQEAAKAFTEAIPMIEEGLQRQALVDAQSTFQSVFGSGFTAEDEDLIYEAMIEEINFL